ncbi:diguanylate cyclase, partial [Streptomyces regensis]
IGTGQATTTAFSVPEHSLGWWKQHLEASGVTPGTVVTRDNEESLTFRDPDGLQIALVAHPQPDPRDPWDTPFVPAEHAIRGLHSVTMSVTTEDATADMLTRGLGLSLASESTGRYRFQAGDGGPGTYVDVEITPDAPKGVVAGGTVHHVAWRAADDEEQLALRADLVDQGVGVTSVLDRQYFRSIYFREPGGVLQEVATDQPGFDIDEPLLELGRALKLPPWLEPTREQIAAALPQLELPAENNPER